MLKLIVCFAVLCSGCITHQFNKAYKGEMQGIVLKDLGGAHYAGDCVDYIRLKKNRGMALYCDTNFIFIRMRHNIRLPKDTLSLVRGYRER